MSQKDHHHLNEITQAEKIAQGDYRGTVFLPRTNFPMRGNLPTQEPKRLKQWEAEKLDQRIKEAGRQRKTVFTLHDGPPYANGRIHIGHALNKVMKDVINRAQRMSGKEVRYIPGWDCHGLPIEWKVEEENRKKKKEDVKDDILGFRAQCRDYAKHWVSVQEADFKRVGVQAEWQNRYVTMDYRYESGIAKEIGAFLLSGRLYRGLKPVMWSPVERTALAEAEIEYHDVKSRTLFVAFPIKQDPTHGKLKNVSAVMWTTTPWTVPLNRALAYNPELEYCVIEAKEVTESSLVPVNSRLLLAKELVEDFVKKAQISKYRQVSEILGADLEGATAYHPFSSHVLGKDLPNGEVFYNGERPFLGGDFVTAEAGTGVVHMAPAHGDDDFRLCISHGIKITEDVLDNGLYADHVSGLSGVHVFKAADPVCDLLNESREHYEGKAPAGLMAEEEILHSYPHSWRSKKPIIFRATPQWFIAMDGHETPEGGAAGSLRDKALDALEEVTFLPASSRRRLTSMLAGRPDWCISRQRTWGVPIAIFVEKKTNKLLRDAEVMQRIVDVFAQEGADAWYQPDMAKRFLGEKYNPEDYEPVFDVVDVWFESGCMPGLVLQDAQGKRQEGLNFPADLILEGSDQHRGWFQSTLLECLESWDIAPSKTILTQGFVLDGKGRKMSKSLGNVVSPIDVADEMGADILRFWVVNSDSSEDLRISKEILKQQGEMYRRIRNSLRWILGGLEGFDEKEIVPFEKLPSLERYILHRLRQIHQKITLAAGTEKMSATHDWRDVFNEIYNFCNLDLSAFYFDIRKDVLYCDGQQEHIRQSVRTLLDILHRALTTWLAPALVFTAEEAWTVRFGESKDSDGKASSVHLETFYEPAHQNGTYLWDDTALAANWERIRELRGMITTELEGLRTSGEIRSSLEASVLLTLSEEDQNLLSSEDWQDICIVSRLKLTQGEKFSANVEKASGEKCARCWKVLEDVGQNEQYSDLCPRCVAVVKTYLEEMPS
ncbi:isoleucine--tRNA ligase [Acetobacteraceae bacterium]|nr:isoleucine--tRNA ligase [Acetobacteraceae bacterium]